MTDNENQEEVGTSENDGKGDKFETTAVIERARQEREKLEAANAKKEELLNREEALMAKKILGGESSAGEIEVKETEDEKWAREAKLRYAGTGMDPTE